MFQYYFIWTRKWITLNQSIQSISDYLFYYINWRVVNYHISPRHAYSPEWLVLGWKYSPKSFYTHIWWVGERWFPTLDLLSINVCMVIRKMCRLLSELIRLNVVLALPHFTYPLHARWRIRPWCTASICLCLWLVYLSLPNCSSLSFSTVVKLLSASFSFIL